MIEVTDERVIRNVKRITEIKKIPARLCFLVNEHYPKLEDDLYEASRAIEYLLHLIERQAPEKAAVPWPTSSRKTLRSVGQHLYELFQGGQRTWPELSPKTRTQWVEWARQIEVLFSAGLAAEQSPQPPIHNAISSQTTKARGAK